MSNRNNRTQEQIYRNSINRSTKRFEEKRKKLEEKEPVSGEIKVSIPHSALIEGISFTVHKNQFSKQSNELVNENPDKQIDEKRQHFNNSLQRDEYRPLDHFNNRSQGQYHNCPRRDEHRPQDEFRIRDHFNNRGQYDNSPRRDEYRPRDHFNNISQDQHDNNPQRNENRPILIVDLKVNIATDPKEIKNSTLRKIVFIMQ